MGMEKITGLPFKGEIGVKRFNLDGVFFEGTCPGCGMADRTELVDFIQYPVMNKPFSQEFCCGECEHEWTETLEIRLSIHLVGKDEAQP